MARRRILVLFAQEWDRLALADRPLADRYEFVHSGFDLFRFPENARLLAFDARRYVDHLVRLARREGVAGVISPHEQFGSLIAAEVAQRIPVRRLCYPHDYDLLPRVEAAVEADLASHPTPA